MHKTAMCLFFILCLSQPAMAVSGAPEIIPLPGQVNPYQTRSELLMDATKYVGVLEAKEAVEIWAKGLEKRSAAMQYIVMTDSLKNEYAEQLDALQSNWVTGMSNPSVINHAITEPVNRIDDTHAEIKMIFALSAAWLPYSEYYDVRLWLVNESGFWRIERISADEELYFYTLYKA